MSWIARSSAVAAIAGILSLGAAGSALASTGPANFGQRVSACAHAMLPSDLGPHGSISMTMPDATSAMNFSTFGAMVTYMRSQPMCS